MSLKWCVAVTVLKGQFLNEVEFMLKSESRWHCKSLKCCITFYLGVLAIVLFFVSYVFTLPSLCLHFNGIRYIIIDVRSSGWFCIREVLCLNVGYYSAVLILVPTALFVPSIEAKVVRRSF